MAIRLELTLEQEERVRAAAAMRGLDEQGYIRQLIDERTPPAPQRARYADLSPDEWMRRFREFAEEHMDLPPLPDEALSRESIYEDNGL